MKYYIAVDKGSTYSYNKRYEVLLLNNLAVELNNISLVKNNNLKSLSTFTMSFENEGELKKFLLAKGLLSSNFKNYNLVFVYTYKDIIKTLNIPYQNFEKYFDVNYLTRVIVNKTMSSKDFLHAFIKSVNIRRFWCDEYDLLLEAIDLNDQILIKVRMEEFLKKICYDYKDGKLVDNYRNIFDLAWVLAHLIVEKQEKIKEPKEVKSSLEINRDLLSDAQLGKLETWEARVNHRR